MKKNGLAPLVSKGPRILILGSLPGDESLRRQEYYGNPRNLFWQVIAGVYGAHVPESYEEKKSLLFKHHIALWDVCAAAEREGSLDSNIKNMEMLDPEEFFFTSTSPLSISAGWPLERIVEQWKQILTAYEKV